MTIEKECPCSETSELTDNSTEQYIDTSIFDNDCTSQPDEKLAVTQVRAPSSARDSGQPPTITYHAPPQSTTDHQPHRGAFQAATQFEPAMQCLCHAYRVSHFAPSGKYGERNAERFNWKWPKKEYAKKKDKVYEVKVKRNHYRHYSKPYAQCEGSEGIPKKKTPEAEKVDLGPQKYSDIKQELEEISERIDIYYFDHGNSAYYRTTDSPPILATEKCAEKTDYAATRFWAEIFGTVHIGIAFVTAFILQLLRFILFSIIRPLTVGILQLFADYFIKPALSIIFNALIQPILILLYNIATSLRDLCEPIAEALGFFLREIAAVISALRIVEVNRTTTTGT